MERQVPCYRRRRLFCNVWLTGLWLLAMACPSVATAEEPTGDDSVLRVLMIENEPRWEYRILQRLLDREEKVSVRSVLLSREAKKEDALPDRSEIFASDVVVLGDVDPRWLGEDWLKTLREYVEDRGGGLLLAGGTRLPADYYGGPLDLLLPVEADDTRSTSGDYSPGPWEVAAEGKGTPMFHDDAGSAAIDKTWGELPSLPPLSLRVKAKMGSAVLARQRSATGDGPAIPMLVQRDMGAGRVIFHNTDSTWRWRKSGSGLDLYRRFWLAELRYLARKP